MMEKLNITTKNYDTVFKDALNKYKEDVIDFLGIECGKIVGVEPTELPEIEAYLDKTFPNSVSLFKLFLISEISFPSNAYFLTSFEKESLSA